MIPHGPELARLRVLSTYATRFAEFIVHDEKQY